MNILLKCDSPTCLEPHQFKDVDAALMMRYLGDGNWAVNKPAASMNLPVSEYPNGFNFVLIVFGTSQTFVAYYPDGLMETATTVVDILDKIDEGEIHSGNRSN